MAAVRWRGGNGSGEEEEDEVVVAAGVKMTTGGTQEVSECDGGSENGCREAVGSGRGVRHSLMQRTCPRQQMVWLSLVILGESVNFLVLLWSFLAFLVTYGTVSILCNVRGQKNYICALYSMHMYFLGCRIFNILQCKNV